MEQVDEELPVKWNDLRKKCPSIQSLALELTRFFDLNINWKHRALYDALAAIAGLEKTEDKDLNSLDLRLRTESFLEMKLKGESYAMKRIQSKKQRESKKVREERNETDAIKRINEILSQQ